MLRMGFIDDVEWILEQTPTERQIALFSATLPSVIRRIAKKHLHDPREITIKVRTATADTIRQRYWLVSGVHKLDALTRILEGEPFEGIIIFVRTKVATVELAEKLEARGYRSAPLNGDIPQNQRERTVERLKQGKLDILVATDVAARGLDVERISHVINYDIPYDTEAYIHRIGRTGRAGRKGDAILFVAPREKRMLHAIERATRQKIEMMHLPSHEVINDKRIDRFTRRITDTLAAGELDPFLEILTDYEQAHNVGPLEIAAALAKMAQGDEPLLLKSEPRPTRKLPREPHTAAPSRHEKRSDKKKPNAGPGKGMERFRLEVGHRHGVKPGNIVGAVANEAGLESQYIGRIDIFDDHSTIDLPEGMPKDIFQDLKKARVAGQPLRISRLSTPKKRKKLKTRASKGRPAKAKSRKRREHSVG